MWPATQSATWTNANDVFSACQNVLSANCIVYVVCQNWRTLLRAAMGRGRERGRGGVATKEPALKICHCYVAAVLLDAMPSFYYVMCGVFAIMPA